jgi:hypothetical protein
MAGSGKMAKVRFLAVALVAALLAGGAVAWMQRDALRSWYCVRGLLGAAESDRERWLDRVAALGEPAVPALLDALDGGPEAADNARAGLARLADGWGPADPRTAGLARQLSRWLSSLPPHGQASALELAAHWLSAGPPPDELRAAAARLLTEAGGLTDEAAQRAALGLAEAALRLGASELSRPAREVVRACLRSTAPAVRLRGVRLALQPGADLLDQVVGLLRDPAAEVRRAALLAVGPAEQAVPDDGLLPCLHDTDAEVRRLAEVALRGRGLRPEHLQLGRLLTHPDPRQRLCVLDHLRQAPDLDPGVWLRRLSHDSSPAVRVAALRVMTQQTLVDLSDRVDQMARSDPSPTVCQLARYYLTQPTLPSAR